jgi:glycosyltransferase involved in cell wall biosynthesis
MSRKIVFINQTTGYLTIDVINEFVSQYYKVALITGSIRVQDTPLSQKVTVSKIVRYNRGNTFRKGFSWLIGTIQIFFLLKFKYRDFEKFFYSIPPTAYLLALKLRFPFSIMIFDLYPEALKANGFNERSFLYRWWAKRNRKVFPYAYRIFTLSENMKSQVQIYSVNADVRVISNWSAFSGLIPIQKSDNKIIKREGLNGKFLIQYSGNIGVTHNVETLIEVADLLKYDQDLEFQIIGRGERSSVISDMINKKGLVNCKLLPFRKDEELFESLCAADLAVITLDNKTSDISVPSKTYNIMAAGVPVMAIAPLKSAVSGIILEYQIGKAFDKSDIINMCEFVLELKNNPDLRNKLSANALSASKKFSNANAVKYLQYYNEQ